MGEFSHVHTKKLIGERGVEFQSSLILDALPPRQDPPVPS